jgi:hypothetical protein
MALNRDAGTEELVLLPIDLFLYSIAVPFLLNLRLLQYLNTLSPLCGALQYYPCGSHETVLPLE